MKTYNPPIAGTLSLKQLEIGDIIAIHKDSGFLPSKIQFFMKLWSRIHYGVKLPIYYNHTFMVIDPYKLDIAEAIKEGFVVHNIWKEYSPEDLRNMIVFRLKEPLTSVEKNKILKKRQEMADRNIEYEILNFLWWMPYIIFDGRVYLGPTGSKEGKREFCFEASITLLNEARKVFKSPQRTNSVDMQMAKFFNQYYLVY